MVAIYVQKSWLESIPDVANLILFRDAGEYFALLAGKTDIDAPFVVTKLARRQMTEKGQAFMPCKIPAQFVVGIFDLTQKEESVYGFHEKKEED
jgi:hypothetical protein